MPFMKFSHIAINCKDMAATEAFYTKYFGFQRARVIPLGETQIIFLRSGNVHLELFDAEGDPTTPEADGPHAAGTWRHIAFQVEDVDAKLAEMGDDANITQGPMDFDAFIPGWRTVWVSDPDGGIVEISQGYVDEAPPPSA